MHGTDPEAELSSDPEGSDNGGNSPADDAPGSPTRLSEDLTPSVGNPTTVSPEPTSPPGRHLPASVRSLEGALFRYLRQKAATLFGPDRSVAISIIMQQIDAGQIPGLAPLRSAQDIWNLAVMRPSRFEVLSNQRPSVRAISHAGTALFAPCDPPVPKIIRHKIAPDRLVYLYNSGAPQDIPSFGWECRRHCRPNSPYIELTDPALARTFQGTGVALTARKAVRDGMVLLQRANGTFYTRGFNCKIDPFYAEAWSHDVGPIQPDSSRRDPLPRGTVASAGRRRVPPKLDHTQHPGPDKRRRA